MKTPKAEAQRIQYNIVKPHMALVGQTPAQVAGIGINTKDKWMYLLKGALDTSRSPVNDCLNPLGKNESQCQHQITITKT